MENIKIDDYEKGILINEYGDTMHIEFVYPRQNKKIQYIEVGLSDVRASDGIRVHYDFIWSSFPCTTHTRMNVNFSIIRYPDLGLY